MNKETRETLIWVVIITGMLTSAFILISTTYLFFNGGLTFTP